MLRIRLLQAGQCKAETVRRQQDAASSGVRIETGLKDKKTEPQ